LKTTTENTNSPSFVTTPAGSRIPKTGTLAYHPSIGFCDVIGRVGERARIRVTDFSEATDVVLASGTISRKAWMARIAEASENSALAEIEGYEARMLDETDGLYRCCCLVKQLSESVITRTRGANEMLVAIDGAEAIGWEFDEYMIYTPKAKTRKAKAPAPRPQPKPVSKVGTVEDPSKPDWLVAEMNECFGDMWTPANTDRAEALREADARSHEA
jgi:hypothetical protein